MTLHKRWCLKCRQTGHIVDNCSSSHWRPELEWFFSQSRMKLEIQDTWITSDQPLCQRCEDLDILHFMQQDIPWESSHELDQIKIEECNVFKSIGKTGATEFWTDCPLCCCLFALTPNPSSTTQDIYLCIDWTMCRLTGESGISMDIDEKRLYAKCLLVALSPSSTRINFSTLIHRGDALCIMEEDEIAHNATLGGRLMEQRHFDPTFIQEWLSLCSTLHSSDCRPVWTTELESIRLLDVEKREVVNYPGNQCDYVALSYVVGNTQQLGFKLESRLDRLPQTLEDAIACVKALRIRYLWVDSLCIDQSSDTDKRSQINKMWSIYRGAYLTIIALSGSSADTGLTRFSRPSFPQLACRVKGKRLVGLMPTLSQQIWVTPWGKRAWTLQEGILSPRCVYISDHQLHWECGAFQCCESLDQSRSWGHNLSPASNTTGEESFVNWMMKQIGAGALRNPLDDYARRMDHWGAKLTLYTYRSMTREDDVLNAFTGVLQRLESMYPQGFFWGLPVEDMPWALLWVSQWPPERRNRFTCPTWSWASWKGGVWPGYPIDVTQPQQFPVHLRIHKAEKGRLVTIFQSSESGGALRINSEAIEQAAQSDPGFDVADIDYSIAEKHGYLFIEALGFENFRPDFSSPHRHVRVHGEYEIFIMTIGHVRCGVRIMSTDQEISPEGEEEKMKQGCFLLLAKEHHQELAYFHLLLVRWPDTDSALKGVAVRVTVMDLLVPIQLVDKAFSELRPRRYSIVLG